MRYYFLTLALLVALGSAGCRSADVATSQAPARDQMAGDATPWWEKHRAGSQPVSTSYSHSPSANVGDPSAGASLPTAGNIRLMRPEALHTPE